MMELSQPVNTLRGVGGENERLLKRIGIETVKDLIENVPRRYDDYSNVASVSHLKPGIVTLKVQFKQITSRYVRRGLHITEALASDDTGSVRVVWFNQPYRPASLKKKTDYYISGEFGLNYKYLSILNPAVELASSFPVNTARIVPVYKETKGLKSATLRRLLKGVMPLIEALPESLPDWLVRDYGLISRALAYKYMHFPPSLADLTLARQRLGFEEVLGLTVASLLNKQDLQLEKALLVPFKEILAKQFVKNLPFSLTNAQRKCVWQIYKDMGSAKPMNRLIEGDVGSGKTVVAVMAALMAMEAGLQVVMLVPTELVARQHAQTLHKLLKPLGKDNVLSLLVGSMSASQKRTVKQHLSAGEVQLIVGTHALLEDNVIIHKLGLIIIDEQHRFGVEQRKLIRSKAGHMPHVLSMTATPIPRTLALTLYGELSISVLDELPPNRKPVKTTVQPFAARQQVYDQVRKLAEAGEQVFIVCPLVKETEGQKLMSAEALFKELTSSSLKGLSVGLLHGKVNSTEKQSIMADFSSGKCSVLIATTVVEVGVDVPNATTMVIENADRFGLAQIHQLRGRVGRGSKQANCILITSDNLAPSRRLRAVAASNNGFELADLDLELRGPGALYGTLQHGALDLRVAKLSDHKLIASARSAAQELVDRGTNLLQYPELAARVNKVRAITNLN